MTTEAAPGRQVKHRDNKVAFAMLAPALILLSIFVLWPLVYAGYISFFTWSFYEEPVFVGFNNFRMVIENRVFWESIGRGLIFSLIVVPSVLVISFLFASLVKTMGKRMATILKISIYIPTVVSFVIAAVAFVLVYEFRQGFVNFLLSLVGIADQPWLGSAKTALYALTVPAIWQGLGISSLIMLAGLLDIPDVYYEAADIDGAGWWKKTFSITIPLLRNIILFLIIFGFFNNLQTLDLPLIMTNGGPVQSTTLPNVHIFQRFINDLYVGYPIAGSLLLLVVFAALSMVIFRIYGSQEAME